MSTGGATYGTVLALLLLFLWPSRGMGQTASNTLATDTLVAGILATDTLVADSIRVTEAVAEAREAILAAEGVVPLDTTLADSLLAKFTKRRERAHFTPNPIRSMWLALVIPGGGQVYNRKLWKLPIVYGGFLGCAYALTWNNQMLRDYSQAYLDIMDDDPNTKSYEAMLPLGYDITGKEDRFKTIFKNKKDHFRKYRDMSILAFVGVYLISVVDAYVDAELSTFDISRDLSLRLEPAIISTGGPTLHNQRHNAYGLSCCVRF